jgi:hypothetical protein
MARKFESQLRGYASHPERLRNDPTFPIFELGYATGKNDVRKVVLDYLEIKFLNSLDRPEKDTPEYKYLLGFAQHIAELMRNIEPGAQVDNEG